MMGLEELYHQKEDVILFLVNPSNNYIIISGPDLAGKSSVAKKMGKYIEEKVGKKNYCHVYEVLDNPFGRLTRFSLDKGKDSRTAKLTQALGVLLSYFYSRATVVYPMRRLGKRVIQIRGSEYELGFFSEEFLKSKKGRWLTIILSKLTKDASKVTLVGGGKKLVDRKFEQERISKPEQTYERNAGIINRVVKNMLYIHDFLSKVDDDRLPDILFDTTSNESEFGSSDVAAKLRRYREARRNRTELYTRLKSTLHYSGSRISSALKSFIERRHKIEKESNGLEHIVEEADNAIKREKNNH